eukprot:5876503-Pyramimonas_sp.AAC.1
MTNQGQRLHFRALSNRVVRYAKGVLQDWGYDHRFLYRTADSDILESQELVGGKCRSNVDAREPQNPTKREEYQSARGASFTCG